MPKLKKKKKIKWNDILTLGVIIVSAIAILILISGNFLAVGKATQTYLSTTPSKENVISLLNNNSQMWSGTTTPVGNTYLPITCNIVCEKKFASNCIVAWEKEDLHNCADQVRGEYSCLCLKQ